VIAAAALCSALAAASAPAGASAGTPLGEGLQLFRGAGNAILVAGPDSAVVVDAPDSATEAGAIAGSLPAGVTIRWVLRTAPLGAPRAGEELFTSRGALTAGTPEGLRGVVGPRLDLRGRLQLHLGGSTRVELREFPGPAAGGAIAVVPEAGVVLGGAVVPIREIPVVSSDPARWIDALTGLLEEFPSAAYVPARGDAGRALDVRFLRDYLASLRRGVVYERSQGRQGEAAAKALVERQRSRYGMWSGFAERAAGNVSRMEAIVKREEAARAPAPSPTAARSRQSSSR
jgi:hypothetical protein